MVITFTPDGSYPIETAPHPHPYNRDRDRCAGSISRGQAAKLLAGVSATSSSFEMAAYQTFCRGSAFEDEIVG
jgi:hypothetical protein